MKFDLEQFLKKLCDEHRPRLDLYERLERIRTAAESIWQKQRLEWFTDHGAATHSRYIVEQLGDILKHILRTEQGLNPHELYVLLASCYLHDIGMQFFQSVNGHSREQFDDDDYKFIRKNHPKKSKELIIARTKHREKDEFNIGLDFDPQYLVPIALVCQGHGSDFFIDTLKELRNIGSHPGNMPFRGELLAALLLMGDELDLHERRATFPQEFALSPISLLHHHIHHYVTKVDILDGRTTKYRRIKLLLEFPEDADEYRADIRNWITRKLRRQIELTNPILEEYTQGELVWDHKIEVQETVDHYGVRRSLLTTYNLPALHELKHDLFTSQTVDRKELVDIFQNYITENNEQFRVIKVIDQEQSDWSHIIKRFTVFCKCKLCTFIHIGFHQSVGHDSIDLLHQFSQELEDAGWTCSIFHKKKKFTCDAQADNLSVLSKALVDDLKSHVDSPPLVLILERIDRAEYSTLNWIQNWLLPELHRQNIKSIAIITQFGESEDSLTFKYNHVFRLLPFTENQIAEFLQKSHGLFLHRAQEEALYLFSSSLGLPERIYNALFVKQMQSLNISG